MKLTGAAVKRFYPGMTRTCALGHNYVVTDAMSRRGSYTCPQCASERAVEYARRNREKKRAWNNAYHKTISGRRAIRTRAYRSRYPEIKAAHQAVQTAIRNGSLKREPCAECGVRIGVHAHHDDYAKPLDVVWLCHAHHMGRHAMLAEREKE